MNSYKKKLILTTLKLKMSIDMFSKSKMINNCISEFYVLQIGYGIFFSKKKKKEILNSLINYLYWFT